MKAKQLILFVCSFLSIQLTAQNDPVGAYIGVNKVNARVNSNGGLFHNFEEGRFIAPYEWGQPSISTIRASGLWLAGKDAGGNLRGAIQTYNQDDATDFRPVPGANKIWRVTKDEIEAHLADFNDNGVIDNPIESIFAWPGRENIFFENYNVGYDLDLINPSSGIAPFYDATSDGIYNPNLGEYPIILVNGCPSGLIPTPNEMLWFTFDDDLIHSQSQMEPIDMEVQCQVFAFNCEEDTPLNNTIIVRYKLINFSSVELDSAYVGIFTDFDIGNVDDDFLGSDPSRNLIYAYNGDEVDEGGYETNAPAMAMDILRGPKKPVGDSILVEVGLESIVALDDVDGLSGTEYYNLLQGLNTDGSPLPIGNILYPDNPNDPTGNSEVTAGNAPGDRKALGSMGPFVLQPGAVNEFIIAYTFFQEEDNTPLENVDIMLEGQADIIQSFFDNCFSTMGACSSTVPTRELTDETSISLFPNPADEMINVVANKNALSGIRIHDLNGRLLHQEYFSGYTTSTDIDVSQFQSGVYVLHVDTKNSNSLVKKIVVAH